jgi:heat-inducible transcriptional repressor
MPMAIHGVSEVIRQPEFSQLEQVQMLLHLLEQEQEQRKKYKEPSAAIWP